MDALLRYEYVPGVGGVNFSEVDEPAKPVKGGSGRSLLVQVHERSVTVSDHSGWNGDSKIFINAVVEDSEIHFGLFVRRFIWQTGEFGPKHPDLFPVLFAQCALAFFDENKVQIRSLKQDWNYGSVSAWQYWKMVSDEKNPFKPEAAVRITSGGKLAKRLGFDEMIGDIEHPVGGGVGVVWRRNTD